MTADDELTQLAQEERTLQFEFFNAETAWELGQRLKLAAEARRVSVSIEIRLAGQTLFYYAMPGTTPDNAEWIRRKRNVVERFRQSSYAIGVRLKQRQSTLEERYGLSLLDYAAHGGCFPLILRNTGCVGTITVSGAPQLEDHQLVTRTIADFLGLSGNELH
ncbi:heme-degrading domain-containing protein [Enterobacillus tribolii]|uniref:UPF0303 protein C8D90_101857 n=1 Tax=Enterobacillus tribolii TaxID=1487935 RepID=A0A370R4R0_9GAMM|nr:heme-degrading domain-containing protein [Enterobacillus tribolii]MBW7983349.1 heme-degrading domain-containing protein [Enterobacillus tribolii]RDK97407.1 uncharacterized protein (UPF0303 family) [Enterobacillus tribolii]